MDFTTLLCLLLLTVILLTVCAQAMLPRNAWGEDEDDIDLPNSHLDEADTDAAFCEPVEITPAGAAYLTEALQQPYMLAAPVLIECDTGGQMLRPEEVMVHRYHWTPGGYAAAAPLTLRDYARQCGEPELYEALRDHRQAQAAKLTNHGAPLDCALGASPLPTGYTADVKIDEVACLPSPLPKGNEF